MKLICISDIHLTSSQPVSRKDNILKTGLSKMKFILKYAESINADILQAGDFCDKSRDWFLLARLILLLKKYRNVRIYTVRGQHDSYYRSSQKTNPTTMSVLHNMGLLVIMNPDRSYDITDDWDLYGCGWGEKLISHPSAAFNILVTHAPISESQLFPKQKFKLPKEFIKLHKNFNLILAGDIHRNFVSTRAHTKLINTGSILRLEATKFNMQYKPFFYVFDTDDMYLEQIGIPHKPAAQVLTRSHLETESEENEDKIEELSKKLSESINSETNKEDIFHTLLTKFKMRRGVRSALEEAHDAVRHSIYEKTR